MPYWYVALLLAISTPLPGPVPGRALSRSSRALPSLAPVADTARAVPPEADVWLKYGELPVHSSVTGAATAEEAPSTRVITAAASGVARTSHLAGRCLAGVCLGRLVFHMILFPFTPFTRLRD